MRCFLLLVCWYVEIAKHRNSYIFAQTKFWNNRRQIVSVLWTTPNLPKAQRVEWNSAEYLELNSYSSSAEFLAIEQYSILTKNMVYRQQPPGQLPPRTIATQDNFHLGQCFPIFVWLASPFLTNKFLSPPYQWRAEVWWCPGWLLDCMPP